MRKYDIFISYRRKGGFETAKHLNDLLTRDGYKVSFDIDSLRSGDFDAQLYERIDQCKDFILIVDQNTFERTINQDANYKREEDWLRCELAYALRKNKNVIPVFLSGVTGFPSNLPDDLKNVVKKNGPEYGYYHFNAFYKDLKKRFIQSVPVRKIIAYSLAVVFVVALICVGIIIGGRSHNPQHSEKPGEDTSVIANESNASKEGKVEDNGRHMEFAGLPMNTYVERYVQSLIDQGYKTVEKTTDYYQMTSRDDTIFVFYDKQNDNKVIGVTMLEGRFTTDDIGDLLMGFVESMPDQYENFEWLDEYAYIEFSYGKIVIGENHSKRGTLLFQFIDRINTQDYKLWYY